MTFVWNTSGDIPADSDKTIPWWCCGGAPGKCEKTPEECIAQENAEKRPGRHRKDKG